MASPLVLDQALYNQYAGSHGEPLHIPHAIIRGGNGRRHEVDFADAEIRIEVYSGDETVEIVVEAVNDLASSDRRRFALLNIPANGCCQKPTHQRQSAN